MAGISMNFRSYELKMNSLLTLVLPDSGRIGKLPLSGRRVLYLLHGISQDGSSWLRHSHIEQVAEASGIVVVMPSAGRSLYCDNVNGQNYFSYIASELPAYLNLVFGLSRKREDNFIAGLSMGGLGATKIALTFPENYSAVGSFSGPLDFRPLLPQITEEWKNEFPFMLSMLDDPDNSPLNPVALLDAQKHQALKMYIACGFQDDLYETNTAFTDRVAQLGLSAEAVFEDGAHNWEFWDRHVKLFIETYLPAL